MNTPMQGAYFRLLCFAWDDPDCSLPNDLQELRELAMWDNAWGDFGKVRACFTTHPDYPKRLQNTRLTREWLKAKEKQGKAHESAVARWYPKQTPPQSTTPVRKLADRELKGFSQLQDTLTTVADKHFPPV